ncbi:Interferon-induced GTP-binding protein [Trichinella spiralis]|uniref:Interferon-induced GTP-binding protein n=1 Tax=Trichinella spiralis TaxID=6334 RepID=A0ABR3KAS2_TRISP
MSIILLQNDSKAEQLERSRMPRGAGNAHEMKMDYKSESRACEGLSKITYNHMRRKFYQRKEMLESVQKIAQTTIAH